MSTVARECRGSLPWIEKYRPRALEDVRGNADVVRALLSYKTPAELPHLLLHGPPGAGKTSAILAIARSFYGDTGCSSMVLELNASDYRGVGTVRNEIECFTRCSFVAEAGGKTLAKMVILDEADSLTHLSQCALRSLIDRSGDRVRFCLCCNFISKLSKGLVSRCTSFRFSTIAKSELLCTTRTVAKKEGLSTSEDCLDTVVKLSHGDARRAINLLQSVSLSVYNDLFHQSIYSYCGVPEPAEIGAVLESLLKKSFNEAYHELHDLVFGNHCSLAHIITLLAEHLVAREHSRLGVVLSHLADVESCLSEGGSEALGVAAVTSAFHF